MEVRIFSLGLLETNCFVLWNPQRQALIIDPAAEAERLLSFIRAEKLLLRGVLLTHAHFDHIQALPELAAACPVPVALHPADLQVYMSPANSMLPMIPPVNTPLPTVPELAEVPAGLEFQALFTPGHTPGSVSYYFHEPRKVFAGDTLFRDSVGRTDLPGGDGPALLNSVKTVLCRLDAQVEVLPGHGPGTTIGREIEKNPFLQMSFGQIPAG